MHRLGRLLAAALALTALPAAAHAAPVGPVAAGPGPGVIPGEVVVGFEDGARVAQRERARDSVDADVIRRLGERDTQLLTVGRAADVFDVAADLEARPGVAFAEPNYVATVAATVPDDPRYDNPGQPALARIGAAEAWDYTTGDPEVPIAILDTGVDLDHEDLLGVSGADDFNGHGTHVAGIAAARGNNGKGIAGVAWGAPILSYRVCDPDANGTPVCTTAKQATAITQAKNAGARVANMSLQSVAADGRSTAVENAIADASNMLVVTAAGNGARNVDTNGASYPCSYPSANLVCVSATRSATDGSYSATNFGTQSVDLAAPGSQPDPEPRNGLLSTTFDGGYGYKSGTSQAAPHVAGAAALLLSEHPSLTPAALIDELKASGDPISGNAAITASSRRLNVSRALDRLDTTPPTTTIDPVDPVEAPVAEVTWSTSEPVKVAPSRCSLDEGPFEPCSSPRVFSGLSPGSHTVDIQATDRHPNAGPTARATISVTPSTTIDDDSTPAAFTSDDSATFAWASNEAGTSFECSLDGAPFAECTSPLSVDDLEEATHTFRVRATGTAGTEVDPPRHEWTVDQSPPEATWSGEPPNGVVTQQQQTFRFAADEPVTWQCSLDGEDPYDCASGVSRTVDDGGGPYTFRVTPTDRAGNPGLPLETQWSVDSTAPAIDLSGPPEDVVGTGAFSINFRVGGDATEVTCSLAGPGGVLEPSGECPPADGSGQRTLRRPQPATPEPAPLPDGVYVLTIQAKDAAGNSRTLEARRTVDTVKPSLERTDALGPYLNGGTFGWRTEDQTSVLHSCAVDGGPAQPCEQTFSATGVDGAERELVVTATDAAGNVSVPLTIRWIMDTSAPAAPRVIETRPTQDAPAFAFAPGGEPADDDVVGYRCRLGGAPESNCTSGRSFARLESGTYSLHAVALDRAGNTGDETVHPVTVSLPAGPGVTPVGPATSKPQFRLSGSSTYECAIDGGAYGPCTAEPSFAGLPAGAHTLRTRGITPAFTEVTTRTFDVVPLALAVTGRPPSSTTERTAEIRFDVAGATAVECSVDDGVPSGCSSPLRLSGLADGGHTVDIVATDNAGGRLAQSVGWTVRTPAPVVPDTPPAATPTATPSPTPEPPAEVRPTSTSPLTRSVLRRFTKRSGAAAARVRPFTLAYRATSAGTLRVRVELRVGTRWRAVATGTRRYTKAGNGRVRVAVTKAGARALRKAGRKPALRSRATFTPPG